MTEELTDEIERLKGIVDQANRCLLAIAAAFNGWSNGDDTAEKALLSIGTALGPPWRQGAERKKQ